MEDEDALLLKIVLTERESKRRGRRKRMGREGEEKRRDREMPEDRKSEIERSGGCNRGWE